MPCTRRAAPGRGAALMGPPGGRLEAAVCPTTAALVALLGAPVSGNFALSGKCCIAGGCAFSHTSPARHLMWTLQTSHKKLR